jgi:SAM-dependent methyltransferase
VYDLGCGPGVSARALSLAGYAVTGVDASAGMLALARRRAPGVKFVRASVYRLPLRPCAAAVSVGEVLNYCKAPGAHRRRLKALFGKVFRALAAEGLFIFDLAGPGQAAAGPERPWFSGRGWTVLVEKTVSGGCVLRRRIITLTGTGARRRLSEENHVQLLLEKEWVLAELRRAGFTARAASSYGRYRLTGGRYMVTAVKPRTPVQRQRMARKRLAA